MIDQNELLDKLKRFLLEKSELDQKSAYFITKQLNEELWQDIQEEGEEDVAPEDEEDEFSDFDDGPVADEALDDEVVDEVPVVEEKPRKAAIVKANVEQAVIQKPQIKIR